LYLLSLCRHHLGHDDQARACFQKAVARRQGAKLAADIALELDILEAEVRTVLKLTKERVVFCLFCLSSVFVPCFIRG
jgi:hypothetical protein